MYFSSNVSWLFCACRDPESADRGLREPGGRRHVPQGHLSLCYSHSSRGQGMSLFSIPVSLCVCLSLFVSVSVCVSLLVLPLCVSMTGCLCIYMSIQIQTASCEDTLTSSSFLTALIWLFSITNQYPLDKINTLGYLVCPLRKRSVLGRYLLRFLTVVMYVCTYIWIFRV